jgi:pimeloyl-ACP methyl ester carboxylesterase
VPTYNHNGLNFSFIDEGPRDGEAVLLIHGFASNVRVNWINPGWVTTLTRAGYRVVAYDNRGHGESVKLYRPEDYGTELMAGDALAILDHLGIARANVMGYSMGARISAVLAVSHPERVRRVIFGGLGANMVRPMAGTGPIAHALEAPSIEAVTNPTARTFRAFAEQTKADLKALATCIRMVREPITETYLQGLRCPVLVAVGTKDVIGGPAEPLAKLIPGAQALDISDRDHMQAVGDKQYKQGVLAFLAGGVASS